MMSADKNLAGGKPQAKAFGFGTKERGKEFINIFFRNAHAGIF